MSKVEDCKATHFDVMLVLVCILPINFFYEMNRIERDLHTFILKNCSKTLNDFHKCKVDLIIGNSQNHEYRKTDYDDSTGNCVTSSKNTYACFPH